MADKSKEETRVPEQLLLVCKIPLLARALDLYTGYPIVARRAWPTGCIGRVRRASKGIFHTSTRTKG